MNVIRMFYDKNFYKKIYKTWSLKKCYIYALFASMALSFLFTGTIFRQFNKFGDIIFIENLFSKIPSVIQYNDQTGLSFFDKENQPTLNFENDYFKIDLSREKFDIVDFGEKNLIISSKSLAIKNQGLINYYPFKNIGMDLRIEIGKDNLSVFSNGEFKRKVSFSMLASILKKVLFFTKIAVFFTIFLIVIISTILIFMIMGIFYNFILHRQNKTLDVKKLIASFTPIMFISIICFLLFTLIFKIKGASLIEAFIYGMYSFLIPFVFLKDEHKPYIKEEKK